VRSMDEKYYKDLYDTMEILPKFIKDFDWYYQKAIKGENKYSEATRQIYYELKISIPWQVIAVIHSLEATFDFHKQILNGELYYRETKLVPKGLGPWPDWFASTIAAFKHEKWKDIDYKKVPDVLYHLEKYNGVGYAKRGKNSPYLWSFSNHGLGVGKYVSDGKYSATAVSKQCGAAVLLKSLGLT